MPSSPSTAIRSVAATLLVAGTVALVGVEATADRSEFQGELTAPIENLVTAVRVEYPGQPPEPAPTEDASVAIDVVGAGAVSVDPDLTTYPAGSQVTLTATAESGHRFAGWSGDLTGLDNPITVVLASDLAATATFEVDPGLPTTTLPPPNDEGPIISVWDGDQQRFGHNGRPQRWVNVLGSTSDPDGVATARYSLNGGSFLPVRLGPDLRRLYGSGDFNVQIDYADLRPGSNQLVIASTDTVGEWSYEAVTIEYQPSPPPSLPHLVDFGTATKPSDVVQIVDGPWELEAGRLKPSVQAYDRLVAIGDMSWQDYEVEVPVTVRGFGSEYQTPQSGNKTLVGLGLRWNGHTPRSDELPPFEYWYPTGAFAWYEWSKSPGWDLFGNGGSPKDGSSAPAPAIGETYMFKARVETVPGGTRYDFKAWEQGTAEPGNWQQSILEDAGPTSGSVLLIAHHMDVEFGSVNVLPLD